MAPNLCYSLLTMGKPVGITLDTLAVMERTLYISAEKRLGHHYRVAREATLLMTTCIKSVSRDRVIFVAYMAHLKKCLTLALLSAVRLHHVQAMMNLRQVLETASNAAYALAHPGDDYADADTNLISDAGRILKRSYVWIENEYPQHSEQLRASKNSLNEVDSHSNLANGGRVFDPSGAEDFYKTNFFDQDDPYLQQVDLINITSAANCIIHLLWSVMQKHGGFEPVDDWGEKAGRLQSECQRLAKEMKASDRHRTAGEIHERAQRIKAERKSGGI